MLQDHVAHLEEHHFTTDSLDQRVGALEGRDEARLGSRLLGKVIRQVVEQVQHEIVALVEVHQEILGLRHEELVGIRHDKHLRLLKDGLQVVELNVLVVSEEAHVYAFARHARQQLLLNHALQRGARVRQVAGLNGGLGNVEGEAVCGWHRRPIHVLLDAQEVDCAAAELGALIVIRTVAIGLNGALIVLGSHIYITAEGTNPALAIVDPANEGVDVGAALFASDDGLVLEVHERHIWYGSVLISWQVAEWLHNNTVGHVGIFECCGSVRNAISRTSQQRLV